MKTTGIPLGITLFAGLIAVMSIAFGIMAMADPTKAIGYVEGAEALAIGWAGRNAGIGLMLALAIYFRRPAVYAAAFLAAAFREFSDVIANFTSGDAIAPMAYVLIVFLVLDVVFGIFCWRVAKQAT